jgi:hypothetical protein
MNNNRVNRRDRSYVSRDSTSRPFSTSTVGILPSYDSAVYNQPPPSYEDAVKDLPIVPTTTVLTVNGEIPAVTSSSSSSITTTNPSFTAVQTSTFSQNNISMMTSNSLTQAENLSH